VRQGVSEGERRSEREKGIQGARKGGREGERTPKVS